MISTASLSAGVFAGVLLCGLASNSPQHDAPDGSQAAEARLERGRASLEAGDLEAARLHLREAWVLTPRSGEIAELLVEANRGAGDSQALWARNWLRATADRSGRSAGERATRERMEALAPRSAEVERARAAAHSELQKLAKSSDKRARKDPSAAYVARFARELGARISRETPALESDLHCSELRLPSKLPAEVITSLERAHSAALSQGRARDATRAARILSGLAAQGSFKDLQGERPSGLKRLGAKANEALARARAKLALKLGVPLTVRELSEMDELTAREFTREHADMSNPGLAVTPRGLYRIETSCGWQTLLGVAETMELHHARLASWYGRDPFEARPGLVRIVPEAAGLESEGAPFWWVGGFQGGDTTVMRFSCGTIEGLGHGLTHELTHRFDGALFPGQPSWLSEGKAVWTGGSYGASDDEEFVERHIQFGTVEAAWIKGYGGEEKLRELIEGELEDYRDNYVAGYALYVYLKLWETGGQPLFASKLMGYMLGCDKHRKDPLAWFVTCFADGLDGRPKDFAEFAAGFQEFGRGFYWDDRAEWTENYEESVPQDGGDWVYDEPTWTWSRQRAEPCFGQDQAWLAGEFFTLLGKSADALRAYAWACAVDERSPTREARLAGLLAEAGEVEASWVLRNETEREHRSPWDGRATSDPCPLRLPKTVALLASLAAEAEAFAEAGLSAAALAATADHDELARALGAQLQEAVALPEDLPWGALVVPEERLGIAGWLEDGLTGYEERRAEHCWYVEPDGDLHVGRFRPRESTGSLDRTAHNRHAFTRTTRTEFAGRYLVRCRIQFTTSYVSGALVLGYGRRDRNLRLGFSAGDFYYSIGKKDQPDTLESVGWRLRGLRDRDGPLQGSLPGGRVKFGEPRTNFELVVIVDEAAVHVWIEGQYAGTYHTVDGAPITGAIGFATSNGAMRVIDPRVQRLDRALELGYPCSPKADGADGVRALDLARPARGAFTDLVNQRVRGVRPGPRGSLLVWVPLAQHDESERTVELDKCLEKAVSYSETAAQLLKREEAAIPMLVAVPSLLGPERLASLEQALALLPAPVPRLTVYEWFEESEQELLADPGHDPGASKTWLCYLDSAGVLRSCERFYGFTDKLAPGLLHWISVFKDREAVR